MTSDIPMIFDDTDAMVAWFDGRGSDVSFDDFMTAGSRLGRNRMPGLVAGLYERGLLDGPDLARALIDAWTGAEFPNRYLDAEAWVEMFEAVGFTRDGEPARRPDAPVRLYRAALPVHARGMTWTDDLEVLEFFASTRGSNGAFSVPHVRYVADIAPEYLLAHVSESCELGRPGEAQWIIHPDGIEPRPL